nr:MAG TPA: hypothetical protein [Caudoviricetes sp.]
MSSPYKGTYIRTRYGLDYIQIGSRDINIPHQYILKQECRKHKIIAGKTIFFN